MLLKHDIHHLRRNILTLSSLSSFLHSVCNWEHITIVICSHWTLPNLSNYTFLLQSSYFISTKGLPVIKSCITDYALEILVYHILILLNTQILQNVQTVINFSLSYTYWQNVLHMIKHDINTIPLSTLKTIFNHTPVYTQAKYTTFY